MSAIVRLLSGGHALHVDDLLTYIPYEGSGGEILAWQNFQSPLYRLEIFHLQPLMRQRTFHLKMPSHFQICLLRSVSDTAFHIQRLLSQYHTTLTRH